MGGGQQHNRVFSRTYNIYREETSDISDTTIRTASLHPVHYPDSLPTQEHLLCTIRTASLHRNTSCALSGQPPYTGTPPVHYLDSLPTQEHLLCTIRTASLHKTSWLVRSWQNTYHDQFTWPRARDRYCRTASQPASASTHTHTYPLSLAWTSAPCWSKYSTVATRLNPAAKCKGVEYLPLTSQQLTFCGVLRRCKESKIAMG